MKKLLIGTSLIAMTAAERAAGRYMRAPDHPNGGDGGDGGDGGGDGGEKAPEPVGEEINDAVVADDDSGDGSGEGQPPASEGEDDSEGDGGPAEEGEKKPKSPQERIDQLTAKLREEQRSKAEMERDLEYWVGRANGTIKEDGTPVDAPPGEGAADTPDEDGAPNPADYQYGETDAAYIRDLARYEANKAFEEREAQAQTTAQLREVEEAHTARVEKAKETYSDYEEKVIKGADPDPETGQAKWSCSPLLALGIKTSEYGPDIAYHLASNPEESDRIASLHPMEQAREFGRLEYRFELEKSGRADGSGEERQVTGAPPPPPRAKGGGGKFDAPADTDDFRAFEQRADAHLNKKRRR